MMLAERHLRKHRCTCSVPLCKNKAQRRFEYTIYETCNCDRIWRSND